MNKPSNFFWCGLKNRPISSRVEDLIKQMDGSYVEIDGFDEIMYELLWVFDEIKPIKEELDEITKDRIEAASKQLIEINDVSKKANSDKKESKKELSAYEYSNLANKEPDFEKRKSIYLEALENFPSTSWLWSNFTYFLHFVKKDYSNAEKYYLKALAINPEEANINENYAIFLKNIKKNYENAEKHYLKALEINPESESFNGNYAIYLNDIKKDYKSAEKYYLKALEINPEEASNIGNYAVFLNDIKKDYEEVEKHFLSALAIEPEHEINNGNYANYLVDIKKDYKSAEKYYRKALTINPENDIVNGNYSQILLITNRKSEATEYLNNAFFLNDEKNELLIELWFYRYAHYPEWLERAEIAIENLLKDGVKSIGWNLSENVKVGIKNGHPNPKKLKGLAERITNPENGL